METNPLVKKWYKRWWGIMIIVFSCVLVALAAALTALSYKYWRLIRAGYGEELSARFQALSPEQPTDPEIKKIRAEVETNDDPSLGNPEAEFVIVEYLDFKCAVCRAAEPILKQVIAHYGDTVKLIVRDFPIESAHPGASRIAEFASCAYDQGVFWPVHDYLFQAQEEIGEEIDMDLVEKWCRDFGLNFDTMQNCLTSGQGKTEVNADYASALKNGVRRGTPSFFVNGYLVEGLVSYENWEKALQTFNQ
jgi:protein-disulfide isomerase